MSDLDAKIWQAVRISELEAEVEALSVVNTALNRRIATARELAGHKSLDGRRELLKVLEGDGE